ncbi:DUF5985 family protein [Chthonobacter albigriseus]|uniref:DUF5985 family protein n=1 Tax=Chthonobacter albigriseus TaxID=1683161 RepID=UPI001888FF68|nr:DUF5985 family protein [Chthonobacter albigriseus]
MIELLKVAIYILCLGTAAVCSYLLLRGFLQTRMRLLAWSAVSFLLLAVNSLVVVLDIVVFPDVNLLPARHAASLLAVSILLIGLVWES